MSGSPCGPVWPLTTRPAYSFARNNRYEDGSSKILSLVTVLLGSTVRSPHAAEVRSRTHAVRSRAVVFVDMVLSSESHRQPGQERARARIDVVVDPIHAGGRVDAAVVGGGEYVLNRAEDARTLEPRQTIERVANR